MFWPENGNLVYSRGNIFLIFVHYNYFLDDGDPTRDIVVTINDALQDMDFGCTLGASHSLIQSTIFDEYYFLATTVSDAYPEGIKVKYSSKRDFNNEVYPINKKYNLRVYQENNIYVKI